MSNNNNNNSYNNNYLPINSISVVVSSTTNAVGSNNNTVTKKTTVSSSSSSSVTSTSANHLVNVVVVVCSNTTNTNTTTTTTTSSNPSNKTNPNPNNDQLLRYYCYQDHTHTFTHTISLLQRHCIQYMKQQQQQLLSSQGNNSNTTTMISPMTIHITNQNGNKHENNNNTTSKSTTSNKIIDRLLRFVSDLKDTIIRTNTFMEGGSGTISMTLMDGDDINSNGTTGATVLSQVTDMILIEYHDTYFTNSSVSSSYNNQQQDLQRLQNYIVHQLLISSSSASSSNNNTMNDSLSLKLQQHANTTWLQFTSDIEFQNNQYSIITGMIFYFYTIGQWPNYTPSSSATNSMNPNEDTMVSLLYIQKGYLLSTLTIDSTAMNAIHLFPPQHNIGQESYIGGNKTNNSIYSIFATHCCTNIGKVLLYEWFQQPLISIHKIMKRQIAVSFLYNHTIARDSIRSQGLRLFSSSNGNLHTIANTLCYYSSLVESNDNNNNDNEDMDTTTMLMTQGSNNNKRGNGNKTRTNGPGWNTRKALIAMYQLYIISSQKLPLLTEQLQLALGSSQEQSQNDSENDEQQELLLELLHSLQQGTIELERSIHLIEAVIDLDHAPREYLVQAEYKNELQDVKNEINNIATQIENHHSDMNDQWTQITGINNAVRLETVSMASSNATDIDDSTNTTSGNSSNTNHGYQFRLPNTNDSKILQTQLNHTVTVHRILKNGVYFTTKLLRQLSQQNIDLHKEYDQYQKQIVQDAIQVAATYAPILHQMAETISHLDVLCTLAHTASYSTTGPYCRPIITDTDEPGNGIILHQARHPCVELQDSIDYIPNDYNLRFDESSFLIVTGPNMGGKSTYIRAVGAIVTMAQIGSFVPCTSATINICHHILARVGAGDQQDRGISTFMAEMLESSSILRTATKRSLIIIDELGRGTSTFDGYGLAKAISEYIVQSIGCITLVATHFHELTVLEEEEKSVKNCHVTAQMGPQGLTFLYEIQPGPCLESFGIQVAEMANVPQVVIQDAKRRARMLENFEYRNIQKRRLMISNETKTQEQDDDDGTAITNETDAKSFIKRFCSIPLSDILQSNQYKTDDEKKTVLLQLLSEA